MPKKKKMTMPEDIREYFARKGREGGNARAKKLSKEQLIDSASKAAQARWAKVKKKGQK